MHVDFRTIKESQIIIELGASESSTMLLSVVERGESPPENWSVLLSDQDNCEYASNSGTASSCPGFEQISNNYLFTDEESQYLYGYYLLGNGIYANGRLGLEYQSNSASVDSGLGIAASLPFASYKKGHFKTVPDMLNSYAETLWLFADYACEKPAQIWKSTNGSAWQQVDAPVNMLNRTDFHLEVLRNPDNKERHEFLFFGGKDCATNQVKRDMHVSLDGKNWSQKTSYISFPTTVQPTSAELSNGSNCPAFNYSFDSATGKMQARRGVTNNSAIMPYSSDGILSVVVDNELYILSTTENREKLLSSGDTAPQGFNHYIVRKGGEEWLSLNNMHSVYRMAYDHKYNSKLIPESDCSDEDYIDTIAQWPFARYYSSYLQEDMLDGDAGYFYAYKYNENIANSPEVFGSLYLGSSPLSVEKVSDLPFPLSTSIQPVHVDSAIVVLNGYNSSNRYLDTTWISLDYGVNWQIAGGFRNFSETPERDIQVTEFGGYSYLAVNKVASSQGSFLPGIYRFASDLSFTSVNAPHENAKFPQLENKQIISWNLDSASQQFLLGDNPENLTKEIYLYSEDSWTHFASHEGLYSLSNFSAISRYDGALFLLGGEKPDSFSQTIYASMDGLNWFDQDENVNFPLLKDFASFSFKDYMTVFGGEKPDGSLSNELWSSIDGATWYNISAQLGDSPPPPMKGHKAAVFDDQSVLVTGGITEYGYTANTYEFENGRTSVQKTGLGSGITPRAYHSMLVHDGIAYVFGGMNDEGYLNSIEYTYGMNYWRSTTNLDIEPRANASLFYNGKEFVIVGGNNESQDFEKALFTNNLIYDPKLTDKSSYGFIIEH